MTDVKVALTQSQYVSLYDLSKSIPAAFTIDDEQFIEEDAEKLSIPTETKKAVMKDQQFKSVTKKPSVDLNPEIMISDDLWTTTELSFDVGTVSLELFTPLATSASKLKENSIARFALNDTTLKLKTLSDGAMESELTLKSLRMDDTRAQSATKFRQLIPPAVHDGHQFMVHYSKSGGTEQSSLALVTIDSPKIIFSVDPLFALTEYFWSALPVENEPDQQTDHQEDLGENLDDDNDNENLESSSTRPPDDINREPSFAYRLNIVDRKSVV